MRKKTVKSRSHLFAAAIALAILCAIVSSSFQTGHDYLLFSLLLMMPIFIFELGVRFMDFYWTNFDKYETNNSFSPSILFIIRVLYAFTFMTIVLVLSFFTYETFENSYVKSNTEYDVKHSVIVELQNNLLSRFCCPGKTVNESDMLTYLRSQLESSFSHHHVREDQHMKVKLLDKFINQTIEQVMDVIDHNTGFKYNNDTKQWSYMFDFKPVNALKYHHKREALGMHDRIHTFFRKLTKGFGLTH